jgi:hypothetical protein
MSEDSEQLCKDYLADNLPARRRKQVEQRIANGDPEIISTINRLRSFQHPQQGSQQHPHITDDDPSLLGAYMNQEDEQDTPSYSSPQQSPQPEEPEQRPSNPFLRGRKDFSKSRNRLLQISGGVIIVLLLLLVYYQWENVRLDRRTNVQDEQLSKLNHQLERLERQDRRASRQFEILKTIIRSELYEYISLSSEHPNWSQAIMVWDRSTLRTGWLIDEAKLPAQSAFYVWAADKDNQWKYAGSIDRIDTDSLYTAWNNTAFNQARRLEIRLDSLHSTASGLNHSHGQLITRIQMPR